MLRTIQCSQNIQCSCWCVIVDYTSLFSPFDCSYLHELYIRVPSAVTRELCPLYQVWELRLFRKCLGHERTSFFILIQYSFCGRTCEPMKVTGCCMWIFWNIELVFLYMTDLLYITLQLHSRANKHFDPSPHRRPNIFFTLPPPSIFEQIDFFDTPFPSRYYRGKSQKITEPMLCSKMSKT